MRRRSIRFLEAERRMVRLANYRPLHYWGGSFGWTVWFIAPLIPGWLTGRVFDALEDGVDGRFWVLLSALFASELAACGLVWFAHWIYMQGVESAKALARLNVVGAQLESGGPHAGTRSVPVGDMLVRLRDDPFDVLFLIDNWLDLLGSIAFGIGAVYLLARIDPLAAAFGVVPMILVGLANSRIGHLARGYRERSRKAVSAVGHYLNAVLEASLTVKVSGAQSDVLRKLGQLNDRRSRAMVGDKVWNDAVWTFNTSLTDTFVGLALLVAARGALTAGEIALFATYLVSLVWLPMRISGVIVGRRRFEVSAARLDALLAVQSDDHDDLVASRPAPILGGPPVPRPRPAVPSPLCILSIRDLTVESRGLRGLSFNVQAGSLTVITGPVGAGKSSLLRAIVGLLPIDFGSVSWNGEVIEDRAAFFVPPRCAYVAQVPRLFAESLADNIALGYEVSEGAVDEAIELAAFDADVADLPEGLATLIGARGVRLSGGQAQRAAAARAVVHRPSLLVLDDLTSALDVETEILLWNRLADAGITVIAASNRTVALARADQQIRLG